MKYVEVKPSEFITPTVEMLLNAIEDFAYGYDLSDEWSERLVEFCEDNDIEYEVHEEDI